MCVPPSPKLVASMNCLPPYTLLLLGPRTWPHVVNADLISGDVHFCVPATQASYTVGPDWLRTISFSQSLPGQPEAEPLSSAIHHGVVPLPLIVLCTSSRDCQLLGTL